MAVGVCACAAGSSGVKVEGVDAAALLRGMAGSSTSVTVRVSNVPGGSCPRKGGSGWPGVGVLVCKMTDCKTGRVIVGSASGTSTVSTGNGICGSSSDGVILSAGRSRAV